MDLQVNRAITNLRQMLEARGDNLEDFPETIDNDINDICTTNKSYNTDNTVVFFALTKELMTLKKDKTVISQMKNADEFIETHGKHAFIIVFGDVPASTVLQLVVECDRKFRPMGAAMQYFTLGELQYNPARHVLVPKHEKMSEEEIVQVMKDYQLRSKNQMPVILKSDIIARWLGLKHGDVVRITRTNENSGIYHYYRCCM